MSLAVAYCIPHNDGLSYGVITGAGFDSKGSLVDLYEVDAVIRSFRTREEAVAWLRTYLDNDGGCWPSSGPELDLVEIEGGNLVSRAEAEYFKEED